MANVVFDPINGELRNDVSFFCRFGSCPEDIRWCVKPGDLVSPGEPLGRFVWPDEPSHADIIAPQGCRGTVTLVHRSVVCRFLGRSPAQVLLAIAVAPSQAK
jgi:hypothetical protein